MTEFEKILAKATASLKLIGTGALRTCVKREGPCSYEVPCPTPEGKEALEEYRKEIEEIG